MIDLHCHILPDLDDGPATLDEAVEMCRLAAADGITTIVATPHYWPGRFESSAEGRSSRMAALRERIAREGVGITLLQAAELTISPELPFHAEPPQWESFLLSLMLGGRLPVLAHPERSSWLRRKPEKLLAFVRAGGLVQITGGSLLGEEGKEAREFAAFLLRHNLVHAIASDAHAATERIPRLAEALKAACETVDQAYAEDLVTRYPEAIVNGRKVSAPGPLEFAYAQPPTSGRRWFFFK